MTLSMRWMWWTPRRNGVVSESFIHSMRNVSCLVIILCAVFSMRIKQ